MTHARPTSSTSAWTPSRWPARCRPSCAPMREAGFSQVMLSARDLVRPRRGRTKPRCARCAPAACASPASRCCATSKACRGHLHDYKVDIAKSMLEMCHALGRQAAAGVLVDLHPCDAATSTRLARDLRKLAMLALPLGIKVAYEGLSWGRTINEFTAAWEVVCRADAPNLGLGIDSFHSLATQDGAGRPGHARPAQDLPGAAGRLHVAGDPHGRRAHRTPRATSASFPAKACTASRWPSW